MQHDCTVNIFSIEHGAGMDASLLAQLFGDAYAFAVSPALHCNVDHGIYSFRNLYIHKYILSRMRCGHHGSDYKKAEEFTQPP